VTALIPRLHYRGAADYIQARTSTRPGIALVLGSGLSSLAEEVIAPDIIKYQDIPHWPVSTVPGHAGQLVLGKMQGKETLIMQGRVHFYEGYSVQEITFPVRVMKLLGIHTLVLTNAAGGLNPSYRAGDLMLIRDHINMVGLAGGNPLRGPNDEAFGPRFPDMTMPYDQELRTLAKRVAAEVGVGMQEGVYVFVAGPSFETPAEIRYLRTIGADAVGMSTVPSVVAARHAGIRVLGISTVTNMASPEPSPGHTVTHSEVLDVGAQVVPQLASILNGVVREL